MDDSIDSLKQQIELTEGIPSSQQRLVYSGRQLESGNTVRDYNIQQDSTLHLVMGLRGSDYPPPLVSVECSHAKPTPSSHFVLHICDVNDKNVKFDCQPEQFIHVSHTYTQVLDCMNTASSFSDDIVDCLSVVSFQGSL